MQLKPVFKALNFNLNYYPLEPAQTPMSKGLGPLPQHLGGVVDLNMR